MNSALYGEQAKDYLRDARSDDDLSSKTIDYVLCPKDLCSQMTGVQYANQIDIDR
jgi:hypothetical protein